MSEAGRETIYYLDHMVAVPGRADVNFSSFTWPIMRPMRNRAG